MYPALAPTDTHRGGAVDMGVRGFDFEDRGGGSEPTSPERRERAGKQKCQIDEDANLALAA